MITHPRTRDPICLRLKSHCCSKTIWNLKGNSSSISFSPWERNSNYTSERCFSFPFPKRKKKELYKIKFIKKLKDKIRQAVQNEIEFINILRGMESWRDSRVIIIHLNTHHKEKLLMGECRYNLMLAFLRKIQKWQVCNFDFSRGGNGNTVQAWRSRVLWKLLFN